MIISISGDAGSGKSTIAKMLAKKLKWPRYYIGGIRRQKAKERGMTLAEYNKLGENDPSTDFEVDEYQKKLGEEQDNFVIEGRTSWYILPRSLKLYIGVEKETGAKRIYQDKKKKERNEDHPMDSIAEMIKSAEARKKSDIKRYKKYYNINIYDKKKYDFVIDTTKLTAKQAFDKVYGYVQSHLK